MARKKKATTKKATTTKTTKAKATTTAPTVGTCPHCGAKAGERCVGPNGAKWATGSFHKIRVEAGEAKKAPAKG